MEPFSFTLGSKYVIHHCCFHWVLVVNQNFLEKISQMVWIFLNNLRWQKLKRILHPLLIILRNLYLPNHLRLIYIVIVPMHWNLNLALQLLWIPIPLNQSPCQVLQRIISLCHHSFLLYKHDLLLICKKSWLLSSRVFLFLHQSNEKTIVLKIAIKLRVYLFFTKFCPFDPFLADLDID